MFCNPFSPVFGGRPNAFWGRKNILARFNLAMIDLGSDDRALFFTGTKGCGKTALLEQLSMKAAENHKTVIDLGPEDTIKQLIHELAGFDEKTVTLSPQAGISILGTGGNISVGSFSRTAHLGRESLQTIMLDTCAKSKNGILITVDEVQKVPVEDISSLCNAFQMASRKGHDIMLAVAGLPYSYPTIIQSDGCTYLRRASHEELGLFSWEETEQAYHEVFSFIENLTVTDAFIDKLNTASFGHPYLMQLLGYYLVLQANENCSTEKYQVTDEDIEKAISNALLTYERRALQPLMDELSESEKKYLKIMSECLNEDRLALTAEIAKKLNTTQNKLSKIRANLIGSGIIASPERGNVMFCIPYLADYAKRETHSNSAVDIARKRRV